MLPVPAYIGKYQIISLLGRGGMGEVYKAYHPQLHRYVAIKVVAPGNEEADPEFFARFEHEAVAVASLRHPNIVQVFDFDIEHDKPYMVMEYIEGETLAHRMSNYHRRSQHLPIPDIVRIFEQLCSAVDYAHQQGLLHRDIKPANVVLNRQNDAILMDFGIAKITGVSALTSNSMRIGTPHYMSPEQARGLPIDGRSDIYSLSVMLYTLLAGKLPFSADTPVGLMMQHMLVEPPPIEAINPAAPPALASVALIGMSKKPEERFRTAGVMGRAINIAANDKTLGNVTAELPAFQGGTKPLAEVNPIDLLPTKLSEKPNLPTVLAPGVVPNSSPLLPPAGSYSTHLILPQQNTVPPTETPAVTLASVPPTEQRSLPSTPAAPPAPIPEKQKPRPKIGRLIVAGILIILILASSGALAIVLINKGKSQIPTTGGAGTVVGTVVFTDSNPDDFSHPANVLTGNFVHLKQPAPGAKYSAWLCDSGASACSFLGAVPVEQDGTATLNVRRATSFFSVQDLNKEATTLTFKITQGDTQNAPLLYEGRLQAEVTAHIRHLMAAFNKGDLFPNNTTALITGLGTDALLLQYLSRQMETYQIAQNLTEMKLTAEYILNLISGKAGAKDWNGNGATDFFQGDTRFPQGDDEYGLGTYMTVNRTPSGCNAEPENTYLSLIVEHACNATLASPSAELEKSLTKIEDAAMNISSLWLANIQNIAQSILTANQASDVSLGMVTTLANQADNVLNGTIGDNPQDGSKQVLAYAEQMATISVVTA